MGSLHEAGNHKGCPYNGFVGAYFQRNGLPFDPSTGAQGERRDERTGRLHFEDAPSVFLWRPDYLARREDRGLLVVIRLGGRYP